jgi:hypothetical protein
VRMVLIVAFRALLVAFFVDTPSGHCNLLRLKTSIFKLVS